MVEELRAGDPGSTATSWYPVRVEFEDVSWQSERAGTPDAYGALTARRVVSVEPSDLAAVEAQFVGPVIEGTGDGLSSDQLLKLSAEYRPAFGPILASAMGPGNGYWVTSFMPLDDAQRATFVSVLDGPITFIEFVERL